MQIQELCSQHIEYDEGIFAEEYRTLESGKLIDAIYDKLSDNYSSDKNDGNSWILYWLGLTTKKPDGHFGLVTYKSARVSIPDCDLDFQDTRRTEMFEYIINKYGDDFVAQVVTFGHMKARATVRDVARALDVPLYKADLIAKSIRNTPGKPINLGNSLDPSSEYYSAEFDKLVKEDDDAKRIMEYAPHLENVVRHSGIHAAALLIGDSPLRQQIPLMTSKKARTKAVSQFDYTTAESIGLLKVDLLGLITLGIIQECIKLINERHGLSLTMDNIPYMEKTVFDILAEGKTIGIFQVENSGLTKHLIQMAPRTFGHVADMISLYRPGPIHYIPSYINRLHGVETLKFKHPLLEEITKDTQGIMIYQEQVNQVLMRLGGYHAGDADKVRKAISKKSVSDIEKNRKIFVDGCKDNNIDSDVANSIYDDINEFALYGFNRAHAASYARISLITAWLKANFTIEFLTACLICEGGDNSKRTKYIQDAVRAGITVLPPQIGGSQNFSIANNQIIFGLGAIDGIGAETAKKLSQVTSEEIFEIGLKRNQIENLVKAGCFDFMGDRLMLLSNIDKLSEYAKTVSKWKKIRQRLMYDPGIKMTDEKTSLFDAAIFEGNVLGAWITYHPMQILKTSIKETVTRLSEVENDNLVMGVVTRLEQLSTRAGKKMYKFVLVDEFGSIEVIVGAKASHGLSLKDGMILHCTVSRDSEDDNTFFSNKITVIKSNE